jgi:outer membrane protein OmpA-like peptidoglycan-associated protein
MLRSILCHGVTALAGILLMVQPFEAAAAAPRYVEAPALATVLASARVGEVAGGAVQVPVITWGGDMATIFANGNQARTARSSVFGQEQLDLNLVREDVFAKQVEAYLSGRSPYLRGTLGMINMAADALARDPRTKPVIVYQLTWSAGGDALVVKSGIGSAKDLRGKSIALQAYGPHVDYLTKILADAGLSVSDVKLRWLPDLTGSDNSPLRAFQQRDIDAAFVISPDASVLTSGGTVGNGAEDSVKGARILLSTKTANRIIADVYAVRADYLQKNRKSVESFVHGLMVGQEKLAELVGARTSRAAEYRTAMAASAQLLLDSAQAVADAEGLYGDAEFVGHNGNVEFFANANYPRSLSKLTQEIQQSFARIGLVQGRQTLTAAGWDYNVLKRGLTRANDAEAPRFNQSQVAAVVARKQQQGTLGQGELFAFEIFFQPNQNGFSADLYKDSFAKVINLASTYGGALITIEGHSDPMGYLRDKKDGKPEVVLNQVKQAAKNLSLSRSVAVRDSIIAFAKQQNITLDTSQFAVVGHGLAKPRSGACGEDPCAPKTEREWRDNMRVEFRILQVEAESSVFRPL